jgi:regulatory protein
MLAGREMSANRVRERLAARGFTPAAIEHAVGRLTAIKAIDDRRAVLAAARTLVSVRLRGRHRVSRELERLGFERDQVEQAVREIVDEVDERAILARVISSRLKGRTIPDPAAYRRLFASLLRRGFPADLIRTALKLHWRRGGGEPDVAD